MKWRPELAKPDVILTTRLFAAPKVDARLLNSQATDCSLLKVKPKR
jgi:hypothetical protein